MPSLERPAAKTLFALIFLLHLAVITGCENNKHETAELAVESITKAQPAELDEKPDIKDVLAWVEGKPITIAAYKQELAAISGNYKNFADTHKGQFLDGLISRELLLEEAKRKNLRDDEGVKKLIQKVGEEIMIQELIDKEISGKALIDEEEIEKHYSANSDAYNDPARIRARHILVDSELLAIKIMSDLKQGRNFEDLAREHSLDIPTKDRGGDLGYFAVGSLFPDFEEACNKLNPGEISDIVKTGIGYHIIEVLDKREARQKPLDEVREEIRSRLLMDKEVSIYEVFLRDLKKGKKITINTQILEDLDLTQ
ncbi:MAG: peptidylprolyl isomerase [Candidatus Omnitrophica bacterium]|nr:peptidylprolyl isomerase [Candidatus Omnitrophota bacterium]